jgi:hypothetical protein
VLATAAGLGRNGLADTIRAPTGGPTRLAVRLGRCSTDPSHRRALKGGPRRPSPTDWPGPGSNIT